MPAPYGSAGRRAGGAEGPASPAARRGALERRRLGELGDLLLLVLEHHVVELGLADALDHPVDDAGGQLLREPGVGELLDQLVAHAAELVAGALRRAAGAGV